MNIAALSVSMHQASLGQSVSLALTKMSMDNTQQTATQMMEMLQAPHPTLGNSIDLKG
ncbi:YjfB family protein [Niallia sp. FSL R7-0271]|uniref:YjfB family protein n=1 Tax=Niallia sp. FSL R7-0271 TaxID=2921678 RepID=UPI0030F98EB2